MVAHAGAVGLVDGGLALGLAGALEGRYVVCHGLLGAFCFWKWVLAVEELCRNPCEPLVYG
jgi:hypothetical protein